MPLSRRNAIIVQTCQSRPLCCLDIVWSPSSLPRLGNAWEAIKNLFDQTHPFWCKSLSVIRILLLSTKLTGTGRGSIYLVSTCKPFSLQGRSPSLGSVLLWQAAIVTWWYILYIQMDRIDANIKDVVSHVCFVHQWQGKLNLLCNSFYLGLWTGALFYTPLPHFLLDFLVHIFQLAVVLNWFHFSQLQLWWISIQPIATVVDITLMLSRAL